MQSEAGGTYAMAAQLSTDNTARAVVSRNQKREEILKYFSPNSISPSEKVTPLYSE